MEEYNALIILFCPQDKVITQFKYGKASYLLNMVEPYKIMAMKVDEKFLFFKISDAEEKHVTYLKEHTLVPIKFLNKFNAFKDAKF